MSRGRKVEPTMVLDTGPAAAILGDSRPIPKGPDVLPGSSGPTGCPPYTSADQFEMG